MEILYGAGISGKPSSRLIVNCFKLSFRIEGFYMRNDARDDFDSVPTLHAIEEDDGVQTVGARERTTVYSRTAPVIKVKAPGTGLLWAFISALLLAIAGLAWWSFQQISLMEQQLVATQEKIGRASCRERV